MFVCMYLLSLSLSLPLSQFFNMVWGNARPFLLTSPFHAHNLVLTCVPDPQKQFMDLAQAFPMLSFVAFLGLFLFVVRNKKLPRFVRFNTMQALLLEIILIFPQIREIDPKS